MKWVKHDTDANQDAKLQNVLLDYGLEGYGLYWYCIELIASKVDNENITFELEHDARIIARNTGSTPQKVEEMMRYFVNERLFESIDGVITCFKLARRLDKSMTSNPQMREIIGKLKNHDAIMTQSAKPMQDKIRLDQTRLDKNKPISDSRFDEFWDLYDKKVNPKKCRAKFDRLSKKTIEKIFEVLPDYVASKPIKQFRSNPHTWLNNEGWNDEIEMPLDLTGDSLLNFDLIVSDFNEAMNAHESVPVAIKITDSQKKKINTIAVEHGMTNERYKSYFQHCATSDKFTFMINGINIPAQGIEYFMKEETLLKAMN